VLEQIDHDEQIEQARLGLAEFVAQDEPVQGEAAIEAAAAVAPPQADDNGHAEPGRAAGAAPDGGRKAVATVAGGGARPASTVEQGVAGRGSLPGPAPEQEAAEPSAGQQVRKSEHEKIGRNEPCWCGSGKKFKLCHGR